jgi:hypothetical protein
MTKAPAAAPDPEIPGINAPGTDATDYAPNPWRTVKLAIDKVLAGSYEHVYPPTAAGAARPTEH